VIGVAGGTASGKTSLCARIGRGLNENLCIVSLDSFYRGLSDEEHDDAANYNFDHPNALDLDLAYQKLCELASGKDCEIPTYDFALHKRTKVTVTQKTAQIIVFEGLFALLE
jgi:uridine kinase